MMLTGILISGSLFFIWFITYLFSVHLFHVQKRVRLMTCLYLPTFFLYVIGYLSIHPGALLSLGSLTLGFFNGLFLLIVFFFTYVACHYYVERPVTLRILLEMFHKGDLALTLSDLEQRYRVSSMVNRRLEAMHRGRIIQKNGDRYFVDKKGYGIGWFVYLGRGYLDKYVFRKSRS